MSMQIVLTSLAFFAAAILAGVMGFAIQRGATCTVAAMDELVSKRRIRRLGSMIEASLWVVGDLPRALINWRAHVGESRRLR